MTPKERPDRDAAELHSILRQQESLRAIIESISSELELRPLLTRIVQDACELLQADRGADLVVFPELALTTFFPRWWYEDGDPDLDAWYETEVPGPATKALWDEAARLGVGFCLGFAELTPDGHRFNTAALVGPDGHEIGRYRKIHLPGHREHEPWRRFQHLEKRYFERGDLGFGVHDGFGGRVGMLICNDRRWPESYRVLGLQGVELVCIGYNTPLHNPPAPEHDRFGDFHNHLVMQAGIYPKHHARRVGGFGEDAVHGIAEYEFFESFANNVTTDGDVFSTPANIRSNIEGGLGIWVGYGVYLDTVVCVP